MRDEDVGDLVREVYARKLRGVDLTEAILARTTECAPKPSVRRSKVFFPIGLAFAASLMMLVGAFAVRGTPGATPTAHRPGSNLVTHASSPVVADRTSTTPGLASRSDGPESLSQETHTTAVDFGATQGAIFLVSGGERETMVVWTFEEPKDEG